MGVLLYELLHGRPPFTGKNDHEKCQQILNKRVEQFDFSDKLSKEVVSLITEILRPKPQDRPPMKEVFGHYWMQKMKKQCKMKFEDLPRESVLEE